MLADWTSAILYPETSRADLQTPYVSIGRA